MRFGPSAVLLLCIGIVLSGCTETPSRVVDDSAVTVALDAPLTSLNANAAHSRSVTNVSVAYATSAGFSYYDDTLDLVADESFGHYTKISDDPLVVRYTIADGATWSDGVPVDAADLMLAWSAMSRAQNTPGFQLAEGSASAESESTADRLRDVPPDVVYFDSAGTREQRSGLGLVGSTPTVSADHLSITMTYDSPLIDWQLAFVGMTSTLVPAHVVGRNALSIDDPQVAKDAVLAAITGDDSARLAPISAFWNTGFELTEMPAQETGLAVSTGPYVITDFVAGQYVTLEANRAYTGARQPRIEKITIAFIADPLAQVQALATGAADLIVPQGSAAVVDALDRMPVTVLNTPSAAYEHIDLQFEGSKSGIFGDPRVREAFLLTVPRAQILSELVTPVQKDAVLRDSFVAPVGPAGSRSDERLSGSNGSSGYAQVDIDRAVALLAEAGVTTPEVCILYAPDNPRRVAEFALIQRFAAPAGFTVTDCSSPDWRSRLGTPASHDAALFAWQPVDLALDSVTSVFRSDGTNNFSRYRNDRVDALLTELGPTSGKDAREGLLLQVDSQLWADAYGLPLYQVPALAAFDRSRVGNVSSMPLAPSVFWNVWDWQPDPSQ